MNSYTITEAKKNLGALLKAAIAGEEVAIVCGKELVMLKHTDFVPAPSSYPTYQGSALSVMEDGPAYGAPRRPSADDPLFSFDAFKGSGLTDGSVNHDKYLYDS